MSSLQKDSDLLNMEKPGIKSYSVSVRPFMVVPLLILMSGPNFVNLSCSMLSSLPLEFKLIMYLETRLNTSQSQ